MKIRNLSLFGSTIICSLFAQNQEDLDVAIVSESFGHIIGKRLKYLEIPFDMAQLMKGIQDSSEGKEPPMSEKACIAAIGRLQEQQIRELAKKNLNDAEMFLESKAKEPGMNILKNGKVQYQVLSHGSGSEVKPHFAPLIRYKVKTMNGSVGDTVDQIESVSLDETIEGLREGLVGMKEGEKRIIYIHPELSYGEKEISLFPPNSLLVFEVELLKVNP